MKCHRCNTMNDSNAQNCSKCGSELKGANPFAILNQQKEAYYNCTSCSYLMPQSQTVCPNCAHDHAPQPEPVPVEEPELPPEPERKKTIPFSEFPFARQISKSIMLLPLNPDDQAIPLSEDVNSLTRDKIDPDDVTISSEEHVSFVKENGQWYIDNGNDKAVFIKVEGRIPVQKGSVILLGQTKFYRIEEM